MEQREYRVHKHHRRVSSTGGGRAWTEEEEAYLVRTRMHKMPYKHIAAHLKKTELACRLHYHQMSYGNNGRRRSASVSSIGSFNSVSPGGELSDNTRLPRLSPVLSPRSSPEPNSQRVSSDDASPQSHRGPIPILPKPDRDNTPTTFEISMARSYETNVVGYRKEDQQSYIDMSHLHAVYEAYSASFWSKIATEYSRAAPEISPKLAEKAFMGNFSHTIACAHLPPTPNVSPAASPEPQQRDYASNSLPPMSRGFRAVNEPQPERAAGVQPESTHRSLADRCSVSALLTVEREVRPSHQ
ncbi:conserved hypothetical protein [Talaromyces stipitatus ATCC 10500]|uniref:Myb-like domain-containing protein n=1 Tax=Talaromyces stipitatus (strain ATCC 10500 / CBS 375.48 / QM 6759 / NRRL 1006) TaxID=441959 RepID=B8MEH3_TALSN|nr:uncharacterized protein TSTA_016750 [Talaromyces stipitatus ATCC 10500]EED16600.1 conserved hypothetical protein [Talaromyces stipitatus ATCC 10500]